MLSGCDWFDWWFQLKLCDRIWREKGVEGSSISGRLFVEREKALLMATGAEEIWCWEFIKMRELSPYFFQFQQHTVHIVHALCWQMAFSTAAGALLSSHAAFLPIRGDQSSFFAVSSTLTFLPSLCAFLTSPVQSRFIVCSSSNYFGIQVIFGATNPLCLAWMSTGWFMEEHNLLPWN